MQFEVGSCPWPWSMRPLTSTLRVSIGTRNVLGTALGSAVPQVWCGIPRTMAKQFCSPSRTDFGRLWWSLPVAMRRKPFCGSFHGNCGITMIPHNNLTHPRRPMLLDIMEYASGERVDRTTLEIFLEDQLTGEMGASTLSLSWEVVVKMREPWNELRCLSLENYASPNETWVNFFCGSMWRKHTLTSECICASRSTLLHSIRVEILGCDICAWTSLFLDAKSGRVWDTAYCKLPTSPCSFVFSISLAGLSGCSLRDFPMSLGFCGYILSEMP